MPGIISWTLLLCPIVFSIYKPYWVATFIILYALFWLFRSLRLSFNLFRSYRKMSLALKTNWQEQLDLLNHPEKITALITASSSKKKIKELTNLQNKILTLKKVNQFKDWHQIYHAIMLLTYKEDLELIRSSLNSYLKTTYPLNRVIFILAGEESDLINFSRLAETLKKEYGHLFADFLITIHPKNLPGEIKGKSANAAYASKELKKYLDIRKIPYDDVLLSNFDADTATHPSYFAELTFRYLTTLDRTRHSYQPIHLYHNNIWEVPILIRLVALSCSFWRIADTINLKRYKSFSSRSDSFQFIVDVDYWDPSVIPEDSRQYWTAYFLFEGQHHVLPLYCPLYMDAVLSSTLIKTFQNQYLQLRRWAWGICDFPFVVLNFQQQQKISFFEKFYQIFFLLENHISWATAPLIITLTGWLPGILNKNFNSTTLAYTAPHITSNILSVSMIGIIAFIILSFIILSDPPASKKPLLVWFSLIFQWIFIPFVSIFLNAFPALEAETRLIFNRRLEYQVTEKVRKKNLSS